MRKPISIAPSRGENVAVILNEVVRPNQIVTVQVIDINLGRQRGMRREKQAEEKAVNMAANRTNV